MDDCEIYLQNIKSDFPYRLFISLTLLASIFCNTFVAIVSVLIKNNKVSAQKKKIQKVIKILLMKKNLLINGRNIIGEKLLQHSFSSIISIHSKKLPFKQLFIRL